MSKGVKIALVIIGVLFALLATCVGGAFYWWEKNGEGLKTAIKEADAEGTAFGETAPNGEACLSQGLERASTCSAMDVACASGSQLFTAGCLRTAPQDEGLCEGVPGPEEILDSVSWTTEQCTARGQTGNQFCQNVMSALQGHCSP